MKFEFVKIDVKNKIITAYNRGIIISHSWGGDEVILKDGYVSIGDDGILSLTAKYRVATTEFGGCMQGKSYLDHQNYKVSLYVPFANRIDVTHDKLDIINIEGIGGNWWWWFLNADFIGFKSKYITRYAGVQAKFVDMPITIKYHGWELRYDY